MHTTASAPHHTPVPPLDTTPSPRFDLADPSQALAFDTHLHQHGYAVVASVASSTQILRSRSLFWDALENMPATTQTSRHDPTTWYNTKHHPWLPSPRNGIVSYMGQSDFCWSLRTLPTVQHAFQRIWNTTEPMICSFDGGAAFRPWQRDVQWLTDGGWWHLDQNGQRKGKQCVQGLVSLYDANEMTGGLCVIPGSHQAFEAVSARQSQTPMDFVPVRKGDAILKNGGKLVCCKAGDLIVWDSRTVHCNTPASTAVVANALQKKEQKKEPPQNDAPTHMQPTETQNEDTGTTVHSTDEHNELIRLVAYVCMVPRSFASDKTIELRKKAFETNTQTSHWPHHNVRARPMPDGSNRRDWDSAPANVRALVIGSSSGQVEEEEKKGTGGCSIL